MWVDTDEYTIRNVLTITDAAHPATRYDIVVRDGAVAELRRPSESVSGRVLDGDALIAIPGLVNAHTHAHNSLLKGTGDCRTLEIHSNALTGVMAAWEPRHYYLSAVLGAIEMAKTGTTSACDMVNLVGHKPREALAATIQAYVDVGLRVTLAPTLSDLPLAAGLPGNLEWLPDDLRKEVYKSSAGLSAGAALKIVDDAVGQWHGTNGGRIRLAIGPRAPGICTDGLLTACHDLARRHKLPIVTHVAETKLQALHSIETHRATIVERLARLGMLGRQTSIAHAVWVTSGDIALLRESNTSIAHNPASNLKLGSGVAPIRESLDAGINIALGTDGSAASDNQNMFGAMWIAALLSHARHPNPSQWLRSAEVFRMATRGGATTLGTGLKVGEIRPGMRADITLLRRSSTLTPLNDGVGQLVYSDLGSSVHTVIVDGRPIVKDGQLLWVDEARLLSEASAVATLGSRGGSESSEGLAKRLQPHLERLQTAMESRPYPTARTLQAGAGER